MIAYCDLRTPVDTRWKGYKLHCPSAIHIQNAVDNFVHLLHRISRSAQHSRDLKSHKSNSKPKTFKKSIEIHDPDRNIKIQNPEEYNLHLLGGKLCC